VKKVKKFCMIAIIFQKQIRQILWILLGFFFFLDIITTSLGLQIGGQEKTQFMIPFVGNPIIHFFVKATVFIICWIIIEKIFNWIDRNRTSAKLRQEMISYSISYIMVLCGLLFFVILFIVVNLGNLFFIYSRI